MIIVDYLVDLRLTSYNTVLSFYHQPVATTGPTTANQTNNEMQHSLNNRDGEETHQGAWDASA